MPKKSRDEEFKRLQEATSIWTESTDGELKRHAVRLAVNGDRDHFIEFCLAYILIHGSKSGRTNPSTLRLYRRNLIDILDYIDSNAISILRPPLNLSRNFSAHLRNITYTVRQGRQKGKQQSYSKLSINGRITAARLVYSALKEAGATNENPFGYYRRVKDPRDPASTCKPYKPKEIELLLAHASPTEKVLILLGAHGGLRVAEAVSLNWADVDMENKILSVFGGKGDKDRKTIISTSLLIALQNMPRQRRVHDGLFAFRNDVSMRNHLILLCSRAGVNYKGYHALRRSCGTRLLAETRDLEYVARHLGHESIETARIYAEFNEEVLESAVQDW